MGEHAINANNAKSVFIATLLPELTEIIQKHVGVLEKPDPEYLEKSDCIPPKGMLPLSTRNVPVLI